MRKQLLFAFLLLSCATASAQVIFNVKNPPSVAGGYDFTLADPANGWTVMPDMNLIENAVEAPLVIVSDGTAADSLGCGPLTNAAQVAGKIAVVYRGTCPFGQKAKTAWDAGAAGVIVVNHSPGLVNMLGGDSGVYVDIPAIFVENVTGASLHDAIRAGTCVGYIGLKPTFPVDLGISKKFSIWPPVAALPIELFNDFTYTPGTWVKNNGSSNQTGIVAAIKINDGTSDVYTDQETINLNSGDSVFVAFNAFVPLYGARAYKATYTVTPATADEFSQDNTVIGNFALTTELFAYSEFDFATQRTDPNAFYRFNAPSPAKYCVAFRSPNANKVKATGFSFAMTANAGFPLTDSYIHVAFYKWDDAFADLDGPATYDALTEITGADYVYTEDLREIPVYVPFDNNPVLIANQRYLACAEFQIPEIYVGSNTNVDIWESTVRYNQPTTPAQNGEGTWSENGSGFGLDNVIAMGLHTMSATGINSVSAEDILPAYPVPSKNVVNIPLALIGAKSADIKVLDITGKEVLALTGKMEKNLLQVNTTDLTNGSYVFVVRFDNGKTANYRVVVSH